MIKKFKAKFVELRRVLNTRNQVLSGLLKTVVEKVEEIYTSMTITSVDPCLAVSLRSLPVIVRAEHTSPAQDTPVAATDRCPEVQEVIRSELSIQTVTLVAQSSLELSNVAPKIRKSVAR